MIKKFYISQRFFTDTELKYFRDKHGYNVTTIYYVSSFGEIDFSEKAEKEFLFKKGYPKISARFFS